MLNFKGIVTSTKTYIIFLIIAVALLLFIAAISYRQIERLQISATQVSRALEVNKGISNLFSNYTLMESAQMKALVLNGGPESPSWKSYKVQSEVSLKNLYRLTSGNIIQQNRVMKIEILKDDLFEVLTLLDSKIPLNPNNYKSVQQELNRLTEVMNGLKELKSQMILESESLYHLREATYRSKIMLTPFTSLLLVLFSLAVFLIAFKKIYSDRQRIKNSEGFLQNILGTTNNVISYFEAIRDNNNEITDFKVSYTNDQVYEYVGNKSQKIAGSKISEVYPFLFDDGAFEIFVDSIQNNKTISFERNYIINGNTVWFATTVEKLWDGVSVTSRNSTLEKLAKENLRKLNERLEVQNTVLMEAEAIAKMGNYRWNLDRDSVQVSDNYYRLLDCAPGELQSSWDNFRPFVHKDDLEFFDNKRRAAKEHREFEEYTYRVITKLGKLKYLNTTGHFLKNGNETILVGVAQDITQRIKNEQKLRDRNQDLQRSNLEKEAFNRVVSHDLQEPLRKIQLFISMIFDSSSENLPEKTHTYFMKIQNAANRMQSLIQSLLTYSNLKKSKKDFERVDLTLVLDKVEDDLMVPIRDTGAALVINPLPIVKGIPFQMEQLFTNLIGNSLKYRKEDVVPKILLDSQTVHRNQITENFVKKSKNYHKITIVDNGIGFDTKNTDKIFELFQRLHGRSEYSGTGIGLSICKKIVENHNGHIRAAGELGRGATFYIYLPV
ncbi:PAS domain-containing protein [Flavobacteriaceae bacterium F89]|uniref:histidine kinase n=1 Tax=Cerina litoralis TaxID=2874477 RepID=A0AAE3EYR2_9FLAO|nr:ATP-binding protein [Cerina litoralis]MCG2462036.1 PAS domain-containing protein [Cerina litoralis]